jgi:DNA-binding NarL/FixJ family response regulator
MSEIPRVLEIDLEKGTVIERDFTSDEIEEKELQDLESQKSIKEMTDKIEARKSALAKLAALGLTQEEIAAL